MTFVLLLACLFLGTNVMSMCNVDSDCKPASCCHSTMCVPKEQAPKCDSVTCDGCVTFTLDCGGHCTCNTGTHECEGVLSHHGASLPTKRKHYGYIHVKVKGWPKKHGG